MDDFEETQEPEPTRYSVKQAAGLLGVSVDTIYRACQKGQGPLGRLFREMHAARKDNADKWWIWLTPTQLEELKRQAEEPLPAEAEAPPAADNVALERIVAVLEARLADKDGVILERDRRIERLEETNASLAAEVRSERNAKDAALASLDAENRSERSRLLGLVETEREEKERLRQEVERLRRGFLARLFGR